MKAVVFHGPRKLAVEEIPDPTIEEPLDAIIRITTANICGSDLHPYEGRADMQHGTVLGHENMGIVEAVGAGVGRVKVGDRVSVPFNLACGLPARQPGRHAGRRLRLPAHGAVQRGPGGAAAGAVRRLQST